MFTGIIQAVGRVASVALKNGDAQLVIDSAGLDLSDVQPGDSIACNGVCLTAVALGEHSFNVDVSAETLRCTVGFDADAPVNLEKALRLADRLGGHLVSGHVDGVGTVERFAPVGESFELVVRAPGELAKYIVNKGSITLNGVSLTVNRIDGDVFSLNLIPHTLQNTSLHGLKAGSRVNLEVDMMARYAERILNYRETAQT
ncbi:MAG: riboflavin synthase [Pseudomonadota bacterium]